MSSSAAIGHDLDVWMLLVGYASREMVAHLSAARRDLRNTIHVRPAYERKKVECGVALCMHIAVQVRPSRGSAAHSGSSGTSSSVLPFEHHAVVDNFAREVIHYSRRVDEDCNTVRIDSLDDFIRDFGSSWRVVRSASERKGQEVLTLARSRIGEPEYSIVRNNCEHFVNWCFEGTAHSGQVRGATGAVLTSVGAGAGTGIWAGIGVSAITTTSTTMVEQPINSGLVGIITSTAGTSTSATTTTATVHVFSKAAVVGIGIATGCATLVATLGLTFGMQSWIDYGKRKVSNRVPICIYNDSGSTVYVTLSNDVCFGRICDAAHGTRAFFGVGSMDMCIPSKMFGELSPPAEEENFTSFILKVFVEGRGPKSLCWWTRSTWVWESEHKVKRGDVVAYDGNDGTIRTIDDPSVYPRQE